MYSTLVFVSVALVAASLIVLWPLGAVRMAIATGVFVVVAVASYHAAIASARGYAVTLRHMDEASEPTP